MLARPVPRGWQRGGRALAKLAGPGARPPIASQSEIADPDAMGRSAYSLWFFLLSAGWSCLAWAQAIQVGRSRDPADEEKLVRELRAQEPALAERFAAATKAMDEDRLEDARKGFEEIAEKAPAHSATLRRLSYVYAELSRPDVALTWARKAEKAAPQDPDNLDAVALALVRQKDPASHREGLDYARRAYDKSANAHTAAVLAQAGLASENVDAFSRGVDGLVRYAPDAPGTHALLALRHAIRKQLDEADAELDKATALGFPSQQAERMREGLGIASSKRHWLYAKIAGWVLAAWLLGLLLIFTIGLAMSRITLRAIDRHAGQPEALASNTRVLRRGYAAAIGLAAVYYYISIPILILVVLAGAGAVVYAFVMIGRIPVKLLALIGIAALVTVWAMLRSLFIRRGKPEDPGRALSEAEAPQLWALLREVAAKVGTRPVDKVFLTVGTDLAVTERGSLSDRLRDRGERLLILGAGVLGGLSIGELRAILAHEYGHFSNRDTAGGDVAMTVNASLLTTAVMLANSGVSAWNPTWQFLRIYHALFARITRGASRLQEIMADQFAALAYGARAFCRGLEKVIRRSVEFDREADQAVALVRQDRQPIHNIYTPAPVAPEKVGELEEEIKKVIDAEASVYDSHPPPRLRMELVSRLAGVLEPEGSDAPAWSLFPDPAVIQAEMTQVANQNLREQGLFAGPAAEQPG
jgi:Zn-dependent protease with chaperone function